MTESDTLRRLLDTLATYLETGNAETDNVAKMVLAADVEYNEYWRPEVERFRRNGDWTGIRAPEAEMMALLLREVARRLGLSEE